MATPATPTMRPRWSIAVSRCTADCTPSGMPMPSAMSEAGERQLQGGGQALHEILQHRSAGRGALAEVAVQDARDVAAVLHPGRLVEAHLAFSSSLTTSGETSGPAFTTAGLPGST